ncbi:hypothetical protein RHMOL_Rhmol02G0037700 [Rhododendron molle]|uniref:Uncharacterized protein n=1 Tax=Rhododendron molle TaxID=49168 RepID=A0ACC0PMN0_RHOML|nr:hypothetical protein RHMOL_Rhmol02G0037700 [Rhododendron molle]
MVLCSGVRTFLLCTSEPSDRVSDSSDLISTINGFQSFVAEVRSKPSDTRFDGGGAQHSTNPKLVCERGRGFLFLFLNKCRTAPDLHT